MRRAPGRQYYLLNYCCTRVLLYAKMPEETENEETSFFVKFLSLVAFQLRGPGSTGPPPPPATPMILRQDRTLKFFHKQTFKAKFKKKNFFSKTWRTRVKSFDSFFETSRNCMTLL